MKNFNRVILKNIKTNTLCIGLMLVFFTTISCTEDFEDINTNPNLPSEATSASLLGAVEYYTFAEPRFVTWRGNLLTTSQFSHQFTTKVTGSWWAGSDNYTPDPGWGHAAFDKSFTRSGLIMRNLLVQYNELNDINGQAMMKIIMSLFHQKMTDIYGNIPYSEVIVPQLEVDPPKYDTQKDIYKSILEDLKAQMDILGSSTVKIDGAAGDFIYEGEPQKWKVLANTLRLRMALRSRDAFIADGEQTFVDGVITDCLANPLIDESNEATLKRSETSLINANLDGGFEDVYWGFGGFGSKWVLTERIIALMRDNNDPRLEVIATEAENGGYAGSYVSSRTAPAWEDMSKPTEKIIGTAIDEITNIAPVMVLTAAESYFSQAEAALLGYGGNANSLYQNGILASMNFWGAEAGTFLADEAIATLNGPTNEQLLQVWNQRWLASLTNGYESWALVRRVDMIPQLTDNINFWVTQPNNGNVPKRLPYSPTEKSLNTANVDAAIAQQGEDLMTTALWWDKN